MSRYTKEFQEIKLIGKGGHGLVYECKHKLDESTYAMMKIPSKDEKYSGVLREVKILAAHQHPGVIRYYQCWIENNVPDVGSTSSGGEMAEMVAKATRTLFVVMELCPGTLHSKLKYQRLEKEVVWRHFKELLVGLKYIHENGVIHGDITRDNIFLDANDEVKLGDFRLAHFSGDGSVSRGTSLLGNEMYRAPEVFLDASSVSTKSDMYALGLVLFEMSYDMTTGQERFQGFEELKKGTKVLEEKVDLVMGRIIRELLHKDPEERPSAAELLYDHFP